jgi:flavodoxin
MKAIVIYDSQFGNTEQVARAIRDALSDTVEARLVRASNASARDLEAADLLVIGSPTQRFHALPAVDELLKSALLRGKHAATFDTRLDMSTVDSRALRLAVKVAGENAYAAPRLAAALEKAGATVVAPPEGFIVADTEGPLREGELARAAEWAAQVLERA